MARQNGVPWVHEQFSMSEGLAYSTTRARDSGPDLKTMDGIWDLGEAIPQVLVRQSTGNWAFTGIRRNGVLSASVGLDLIFERVWVEPIRVEAGFITEELTYDISIWNAFQSRSVEFTSLTSASDTGTSLPAPSLPVDIRPGDDLVLTLTIDQNGPPIQDTYWKPLVDGTLWSIYITGIRVIGIDHNPTWEKNVDIDYQFETAMYQTERFEEQRRPLMDAPYRILKASFPIYSQDAHRFFYELAYGHDKIFGVPIYNEMILVDTITQGSSTITTTSTLDNLYNLNNLSEFIAVIDHSTGQVEVKEVDTITLSNTIEVVRDMVDDFTAATTRIYPVFFGVISSVRLGHLTDDVEVVEIEFREFSNG